MSFWFGNPIKTLQSLWQSVYSWSGAHSELAFALSLVVILSLALAVCFTILVSPNKRSHTMGVR